MRIRIVVFRVVTVIAALLVTGMTQYSGVLAADEAAPSCITAKCHAGLDKQKFAHGPVTQGECTICHGEAPGHEKNPGNIPFPPVRDTATVCYECHEAFPSKKFTHTPVGDGECTACHDPHGSANKFQLVAKGGELCFNCHDEDMVAAKYVHGPTAVGGCIACHDPHNADYEKNLRAEGSDLCFMCHVDKAESILSAEFVHTPVAKGCVECHNPHSEEKQFMLKADSPALCLNCHKDKKEQLSTVKFKHGALDTERSCLNCHDAHASKIAMNLLMEPMDLCLSCHNRAYQKDDGKTIMNIEKWLVENTDHHGPIKQKDCSGCHNPHGSDSFRILRNDYPPTFYKPFAIENYNLCFSCHEKTIVLNPETTKLTNFRNGNENLHFTHVNKAVKGRTCRACHETHASNFPKHIREAVPFGSWELPVNYEKSENGGSCAPGCHKLKQYDRGTKVINE